MEVERGVYRKAAIANLTAVVTAMHMVPRSVSFPAAQRWRRAGAIVVSMGEEGAVSILGATNTMLVGDFVLRMVEARGAVGPDAYDRT